VQFLPVVALPVKGNDSYVPGTFFNQAGLKRYVFIGSGKRIRGQKKIFPEISTG
jgi:hypothetical protein